MAGVQTRWPAAPERGGLPHRGTLPHSNTGPQSYTQGHSAATVSLDLQFQPQSLGMCHSRSDSLKESQRHILHKICTGSKSYDMINNPQGWTTTKLSPTTLLKQKGLVRKNPTYAHSPCLRTSLGQRHQNMKSSGQVSSCNRICADLFFTKIVSRKMPPIISTQLQTHPV